MLQESTVTVNRVKNPFKMMVTTVFEDGRISWGAKGLMGYMMSRPDGWVIRKTDLIKRSTGAKENVESLLNELMSFGYVYYFQERGENGEFGKWHYHVYEHPEINPYLEQAVQLGKEKMQAKKDRNKRKNDKKKLPQTDNPTTEEKPVDNVDNSPQSDNPIPDNPQADNPPADNPTIYIKKDFNKKDFIKDNYINREIPIYDWLEEDAKKYQEQLKQQKKRR